MEEFFSSAISELENKLLLYYYNNNSGKDMSDFIRGQIIAIREVFNLPKSIEQFEENKKRYDEMMKNIGGGKN